MHDGQPRKKRSVFETDPVALVSGRKKDARTNLMIEGCYIMMQHAPPLVGVITVRQVSLLSGAVRQRGIFYTQSMGRHGNITRITAN